MSEQKTFTTHQEMVAPSLTATQMFEEVGEYKVQLRTILALVAMYLVNACATATGITNTTVFYQAKGVHALNYISWIANIGFLLTLACGPIAGSLADRLGKKWFMVVGCAIGIVGSFVSSSATSIGPLLAGNALVGIANAGCIVSIAAIQEVAPNRLRPFTFGIGQTVSSVFAVAATFLAAYFAEYKTWNWSFRFNGILYAVAGLSVLLTYFPPPTAIRRSDGLLKSLLEIDYFGMLIFAGAIACIITALTWGGSTYSWSSAPVVGTLAGGCVGLVAFGVFDWKIKTQNGLFDHRLFKNRNFPILLLICAIDGMLLLGVNVLYSNEIRDIFGTTPVATAVILCAFLITSTAGCVPFGLLMTRTKSYRIMLTSALVWCSLFTGLMALVTPDRKGMADAFSALFGIGTAVTTVIPVVAISLSVPSYLLGTAGTLSIAARALGGIVGVTVFSAIYNNEAAKTADKSEPYKYVWAAISCLVAAGAIASCFLTSVTQSMDNSVESALEDSELRREQTRVSKLEDN